MHQNGDIGNIMIYLNKSSAHALRSNMPPIPAKSIDLYNKFVERQGFVHNASYYINSLREMNGIFSSI